MKNVLITGSNGMIGSLILQNCLNSHEVKQVTSLTRKSTGIKHPKLIEIIRDDFLNYTSVQSAFKNQDLCFYCVGVYTGQVPAAEFKKITVDYTKAFAIQLKNNSPQAVFCFLSGDGADQSEKSRILFAREKGKAENILLSLQFKAIYIFRPGYIYPVTKRKEPNLLYSLMRLLWQPLLSWLSPNIGLTSVTLANVITLVGLHGARQVVFSNRDIRNYSSH